MGQCISRQRGEGLSQARENARSSRSSRGDRHEPNAPTLTARPESLTQEVRPPLLPNSRRRLDVGIPVACSKVVREASSGVQFAVIRQRGESLQTSSLDLCVGIAIHARNERGHNSAALFHAMPNQKLLPIATWSRQMEQEGFQIQRAVVAGGDPTSGVSRDQYDTARRLLSGLGVEPECLPMSDGTHGQVLMVRITQDNEVEFDAARR